MEISRRQLRGQYPTIPWEQFIDLTDLFNAVDDEEGECEVRALLHEAEDIARENARRFEEELERIRARLSASMIHVQHRFHMLAETVPKDVDYEHAAAILVYGFVIPSSARTFAGSRSVSEEFIRNRVEGKMFNFVPALFESALRFLARQGVIQGGTRGSGFSLAINPRSGTEVGMRIIAETWQFAREYSRQ